MAVLLPHGKADFEAEVKANPVEDRRFPAKGKFVPILEIGIAVVIGAEAAVVFEAAHDAVSDIVLGSVEVLPTDGHAQSQTVEAVALGKVEPFVVPIDPSVAPPPEGLEKEPDGRIPGQVVFQACPDPGSKVLLRMVGPPPAVIGTGDPILSIKVRGHSSPNFAFEAVLVGNPDFLEEATGRVNLETTVFPKLRSQPYCANEGQ